MKVVNVSAMKLRCSDQEVTTHSVEKKKKTNYGILFLVIIPRFIRFLFRKVSLVLLAKHRDKNVDRKLANKPKIAFSSNFDIFSVKRNQQYIRRSTYKLTENMQTTSARCAKLRFSMLLSTTLNVKI